MTPRHQSYQRLFTFILGFILASASLKAQVVVSDTVVNKAPTDTIIIDGTQAPQNKALRQHSPKKATIMSACLPGLGQVYNGKWWKVPIVYAGLGGFGYMAYDNYTNYRLYLLAYRLETGNLNEGEVASEAARLLSERYSENQLQAYKESYQHNFELYSLISVAWYALNIVDALVDGHLYSYDISDDLSLYIDPNMTTINAPVTYNQVGLSLYIKF